MMSIHRVVGLVLSFAGFVLTTQTADADSFLLWTKGNAAPVASSVTITGTLAVGETLTGNYTYTDAENDPQGVSLYQWQRADDNSGTNAAAIDGATATTYTTQAADAGKYLRFQVIPVAQSGASPGSAATSAWSGPVGTPPSCEVTTDADDATTPPAGSLRQVLANSSCCTTITFASGVEAITLAGFQLEIPATCTNLTIDGGRGVTISGNHASRVLYINAGANVTLTALTITEGAADSCGGIDSDSRNLTISHNTTVTKNAATDGEGGGICGWNLTVAGTVSENTSTYHGGGIYGSVTLTDTAMVCDNTASQHGGGIAAEGTSTISGTLCRNHSGFCGGGLFVSATVNSDGTFLQNTSDESGGGICVPATSTLNLNPGHLIEGNHSDNDNSGGETGGGIDKFYGCPSGVNYGAGNYRGSGTTTIDNCNGSL